MSYTYPDYDDIECYHNVYKSVHGVRPSSLPSTEEEYDRSMAFLSKELEEIMKRNPELF